MKNDNLNISFTGEFRNTIDQKNRLSIPAKYRKALSPVNDGTFVLTRGFDQCLILYPLDEWKKVEGQLGSLSSIHHLQLSAEGHHHYQLLLRLILEL